MEFMKGLLAIMLLIGSLSAQTWLTGSLDIGTKARPFIVKVYLTDAYSTNAKVIGNARATSTLYGTYNPMPDGSPGYITLNRNVSFRDMALTMTHEYCHARQDYEKRAYNETECRNME